MIRRLAIASFLVSLLICSAARAQICGSAPFNLTNGTTADATQVMANFNQIISCINSNVAPINSPTFTGTPAAPTPAPGTNNAQLATTAFVASANPVGANPTATAGATAVNGSATTFMRSDAAPAVQVSGNSTFGITQADDATIRYGGSGGIQLVASNTTINSVACTPGSGCTVPAAAGTLTGGTLAAGVTASSLTSFGSTPTLNSPLLVSPTGSNLVTDSGNFYVCFDSGTTNIAKSSTACTSSDARLKHDWLYDVPGLDAVMALKPGTYDWLDVKDTRARQIGLTAQEVRKVLPQAVTVDEGSRTITLSDGSRRKINGVMSVDYAKLTLPLIVAVQQQQKEIEGLRRELAAMRSHVGFARYARR